MIPKPDPSGPRVVSEAGAIVVRRGEAGPLVLVVTAKGESSHWIFPKGHIEHGETAADAAVREAHEEAGVRGRLLGPAGHTTFTHRGARIEVEYVLLSTSDVGRPESGRALAWLPVEAALERLTFDDTRSILRTTWTTLRRGHPELFSSDEGRSDRK